MPLWVTEAAEAFWTLAGEPEPFPRDLRRPVANVLPVAVVLLPRLRVAGVDAWLRRQGIGADTAGEDRALRACLVARRGQGLIFLDGADPADEQRFSLAHEVAHFLRHYRKVREDAAARLGLAALEVLDGERPPRPEERVQALLARATLGFVVHLMERDDAGRPARAGVDAAEQDADALAFELLAPAEEVLRAPLPAGLDERRAIVRERLARAYGLPPAAADRYALDLAPDLVPSDGLLRRLGLAR